VVRKTNNTTIVQFVLAKTIGDETIATAVSGELPDYGWVAGIGNMPAAYLTGLLAGRRAKARGIEEAILDVGLHPPVPGSKVYAALNGALDAEVDVPHDSEVLPTEERVRGEHIVEAFEHFSDESDNPVFNEVGSRKTNITGIAKKFDAVRNAILEIPASELKKKKKKKPPQKEKPSRPKAEKKPKKEEKAKAPRAKPAEAKPKKLLSRGKGKKGRKRKR
jgi:large subunit ribosomal protein L18